MKALGLIIATMAAFRRYVQARTIANLEAYSRAYRALEDESFSRHNERTKLT